MRFDTIAPPCRETDKGGIIGAGKAARQSIESVPSDGLQPGQFLSVQRTLRDRRGSRAPGDLSEQAELRNRIGEEIEKAVVELAIEEPAWGQVRVANELKKKGITVSLLVSAALTALLIKPWAKGRKTIEPSLRVCCRRKISRR